LGANSPLGKKDILGHYGFYVIHSQVRNDFETHIFKEIIFQEGVSGRIWSFFENTSGHTGLEQGCQIFLGPNIPNWEKIYQMTTSHIKWP
jgi:hypothetical protein